MIDVLIKKPLDSLSFGQWQRVNLAQALMSKPAFLVVDEPAQGLDVIWQEKIHNIISEYVHVFKALCFCISHDTLTVNNAADFILCLDHLSFTENSHRRKDSTDPAYSFLEHKHS